MLQEMTQPTMIEQMIQSVGPAALAVAIMWRWLQDTRERRDHWQQAYTEIVAQMRQEAVEDRKAYEQLVEYITNRS